MRVSPFRNLRIYAHVQLPAAYRSLSRLSSALSAKASALRPFCLIFSISIPCILAYMRRWLLCTTSIISMSSYLRLHMCIFLPRRFRGQGFHMPYADVLL